MVLGEGPLPQAAAPWVACIPGLPGCVLWPHISAETSEAAGHAWTLARESAESKAGILHCGSILKGILRHQATKQAKNRRGRERSDRGKLPGGARGCR